jgi:hypothetical protein
MNARTQTDATVNSQSIAHATSNVVAQDVPTAGSVVPKDYCMSPYSNIAPMIEHRIVDTKHMSKLRTALSQGVDDEPMAQQNNSAGNSLDESKDSIISSDNSQKDSYFIKLGAFYFDAKQNMMKAGNINLITRPKATTRASSTSNSLGNHKRNSDDNNCSATENIKILGNKFLWINQMQTIAIVVRWVRLTTTAAIQALDIPSTHGHVEP